MTIQLRNSVKDHRTTPFPLYREEDVGLAEACVPVAATDACADEDVDTDEEELMLASERCAYNVQLSQLALDKMPLHTVVNNIFVDLRVATSMSWDHIAIKRAR